MKKFKLQGGLSREEEGSLGSHRGDVRSQVDRANSKFSHKNAIDGIEEGNENSNEGEGLGRGMASNSTGCAEKGRNESKAVFEDVKEITDGTFNINVHHYHHE